MPSKPRRIHSPIHPGRSRAEFRQHLRVRKRPTAGNQGSAQCGQLPVHGHVGFRRRRGGSGQQQLLQRAGEFRAVDIETAIDVIFAPVLMMLVWRYSLGACGCGSHDPDSYLRTHLDLALNGLATGRNAS